MLRSKFSASVESFLTSTSTSSSSVSVRCRCPECGKLRKVPRRRFFRRSLPSPTGSHIPTTPLHQSLPPTITLQQQQAQMLSMGYSRVFTLGYLSVASQGTFQPSD